MATLTPQSVKLAGLEATYAACAGGGDQFVSTGRTMLHVKNGHTADQTVTIADTSNCNRGVSHDAAVVVTASEERFIGPFLKQWFQDSNGYVQVTYSGVTSLTIAVLELDGDGI